MRPARTEPQGTVAFHENPNTAAAKNRMQSRNVGEKNASMFILVRSPMTFFVPSSSSSGRRNVGSFAVVGFFQTVGRCRNAAFSVLTENMFKLAEHYECKDKEQKRKGKQAYHPVRRVYYRTGHVLFGKNSVEAEKAYEQ